jgi:ABC-type spermidine/putrescine transport system permease subunit II
MTLYDAYFLYFAIFLFFFALLLPFFHVAFASVTSHKRGTKVIDGWTVRMQGLGI